MASFVVFFFLFASPSAALLAVAAGPPFPKMYAFGDSFTDTGNTHSAAGPYAFGYVSSAPYGITYFNRSTNRYSDGRLVVDFVAEALSLPFLPPSGSRTADFSRGANFAVAGATAVEYAFYMQHNATTDITPQSILTELAAFDDHLRKVGRAADIADALFWVGEIGANDYAYSFTASAVTSDLVRGLAVSRVQSFLEALLKKGAKYIIVQGLPLTGCLPLTMTLAPPADQDELGCSAIANRESYTHNSLLLTEIRRLRKLYPNATIAYADFSAAHRTVFTNPGKYGFTETFKTCCGSGGGKLNFDFFATCGSPTVQKACSSPAKFINWDGVHLTEALYKTVADMFLHQKGYCRPAFRTVVRNKLQGQ